MKRASVLVLSAGLAWCGINDGIGGIKVGLGKTPPGNMQQLAATDAGGNLRLRVPEAGRYVIQFEQPAAFAFWVNVNGEVRGVGQGTASAAGGRPLALGKMFPAGGPTGARVSIPGIPFHAQTRVYREEVEFTGPAEMILRLTEGPPMTQPCPPGMRPPCPAVSSNSGAAAGGPAMRGAVAVAPKITFRPPRPLALERGRSYAVVNRRSRQVMSSFRVNPDGSVTAQMVAKAGGDDNGGGCVVCAPGMTGCFEYKELPPDEHYLELMPIDDDAPLKKAPGSSGQGGTAPSTPAGGTSCTKGAIIGVAWPSGVNRAGQGASN